MHVCMKKIENWQFFDLIDSLRPISIKMLQCKIDSPFEGGLNRNKKKKSQPDYQEPLNLHETNAKSISMKHPLLVGRLASDYNEEHETDWIRKSIIQISCFQRKKKPFETINFNWNFIRRNWVAENEWYLCLLILNDLAVRPAPPFDISIEKWSSPVLFHTILSTSISHSNGPLALVENGH